MPHRTDSPPHPSSQPLAVPASRGRVLIVSYHFRPSNAIGAVRWTGLARELARSNWEVRVITAREQNPGDSDRGVTVLSCPLPPSRFRAAVQRVRGLTGRGTPRTEPAVEVTPGGPPASPASLAERPARRGRLRREISAAATAPDPERAWVVPALRLAVDLVREWKPAVVVTSGPPHSSHVVGWRLRRSHGVRWVADLRDPIVYVADQKAWVGRGVTASLERMIARRADQIITTSPTLTADFRARFPTLPSNTIPNGVIIDELPERPVAGYPGLAVCHVGSIYENRNPLPVVDAFADVLRRRPDLRAKRSAIRFAGFVSESMQARVRARLSEAGLDGSAIFLGMLPRHEALAMVAASNLALVLAQDQHHSIPGKLYESVAMGIPTLAVTERDSATWGMARHLGAAAAEPHDREALLTVLEASVERASSRDRTDGRTALGYDVKAREVEAVLLGLGEGNGRAW
jgi:glycosyltransferase involved in cell wall biosynthesis